MGFFDIFRKKKLTTNLSFEQIPSREHMTIESNAGVLENPTIGELEVNVKIMMSDLSEFIILTPTTAIGGIRYIQACRFDNGINVQLGLEKEGQIHLVEKTLNEEATLQLFKGFYCGNVDIDINEYTPVSFYKQ